MALQRFMKIIDNKDGTKVQFLWKALGPSEETLKPLETVYKDVPGLIIKLIGRRNAPRDLADKARTGLSL